MSQSESREVTKIKDCCFGQEAKAGKVCFLYLGEMGRLL